MAQKLLQNGTILTFDNKTNKVRVISPGCILIDRDRIKTITEGPDSIEVDSTVEVINIEGKIVSPGFVNTHVHSWQAVYRTLGPNIVLASYFDWLSQISSTATKEFSADDIYVSARQTYLEGLYGGVTSYVEHAHNNWSDSVIAPGHKAAVDSGARVWWCLDVLPRDGFPAEKQWGILTEISKMDNGKGRVELGLALDGISGSFGTGTEFVKAKSAIQDLNLKALTLHHMGGPWPGGMTSPQKICDQSMHQCGLPVIFSHSPYLTAQDKKELRDHDLYISITPESEAQFGHGQTTGHEIADQSSLGIDTNWTFSGDLITQARLWLQIVRKQQYEATLSKGILPNGNPMDVEQAFLLITRQGGRALRRKDIGVIQEGAKADLVIFDGESPTMWGWRDPVAAVILHASPGDVQHVLVDGEFRKRNFKMMGDYDNVRARFMEAAARIQPQLQVPPPLPDRLWGIGELGDVDIVSTIA